MKSAASFLLLVLAASGCANRVDDGSATSPPSPPSRTARSTGNGNGDNTGATTGTGGAGNTTGDTTTGTGDTTTGNGDTTGGTGTGSTGTGSTGTDTGVVHDGPSGVPADAHASCTAASDCGLTTPNEQPGFQCVSDVCTCDPAGTAASSCIASGGSWSSFECACFVNTGTAMPASAPPTPGAVGDDPDVYCWYIWRDTGCDPDVWIDTSHYEQNCDDPENCYEQWVESGYYESGSCHGRWVTRCTDGNEYW